MSILLITAGPTQEPIDAVRYAIEYHRALAEMHETTRVLTDYETEDIPRERTISSPRHAPP